MIELWFVPRLASIDAQPQISFSTRILQAMPHQQDATVRVEYGLGDWPGYHRAELFNEAVCPVVAPNLLSKKSDWRHLPRIALSGPRAGWQDWARFSGDLATPMPALRFDSFSGALSAALAGQGVLLASLPLCAPFLSDGRLVRLSDVALETQETYWMVSKKDDVTMASWKCLREQFLAV